MTPENRKIKIDNSDDILFFKLTVVTCTIYTIYLIYDTCLARTNK